MKNILSKKKTALSLLLITLVLVGLYAYMLARPISFGMGYHNETVYDGGIFEGTMKFNSDGTMFNRNTNLNEELKSRYYYKDGYVFFTMAQTDEEYEKEIAEINENFADAIQQPFYADEINAFQLVATENDGYKTVYTCIPAIVFAIVGGVAAVILMGLTAFAFILSKNTGRFVS